jgi:membrane-bound lytic murein transglycosylase B
VNLRGFRRGPVVSGSGILAAPCARPLYKKGIVKPGTYLEPAAATETFRRVSGGTPCTYDPLPRIRRGSGAGAVVFPDRRILAPLVGLSIAALTAPAMAAPCGGDFGAFVATFQREALAKGISQRTVSSAFVGVTPDPQVLALDRRQGHFKRSFEEFGLPRIQQRLAKAKNLMQQHSALLKRIEQQYGVPGSVVIAIWGLETDFGVNQGKQSAIRSLATLAHDCRRTERFQNELADALRIIDRGDYTAEQLKGAWAGEIGQTQFLPSSFVKFAVDFDGNGRRDLIRSVPDVLGSTANYLRGYGWQRGASYTEGSRNFEVLKEWNKSSVYQKTISAFAARLDGAQ